jgi:hypothetical protein
LGVTWFYVPRKRAAPGGGGDPFISNVVLLMREVDQDRSPVAHTVSVNGTPQTDTVDYAFPPSSCYYDANGDYSQLADATGNPLRFGTSDFIFEFIFKPAAGNTSLGLLYSKGLNASTGITLGVSTTTLFFRANGTSDLSVSQSVSSSAYAYVAFIGEGGSTRRIYYASTPGGTATQVGTNSNTYNVTIADAARLGNQGSGTYFTGRVHARLTTGTTRGVSGGASFTSPTEFPIT